MKKELLEKLKAKFNFEYHTAWVYGSYALGTQTEKSDIDLIFYDANIIIPYKQNMVVDNIPVSLNFFGEKSICDKEIQLNNGLYFITRFLSPTKIICDRNNQAELVELKCFEYIVIWLSSFLQKNVENCEVDSRNILSLIYLLKIKMNKCFLIYFANWFKTEKFKQFWDKKQAIIKLILSKTSFSIDSVELDTNDSKQEKWKQIIKLQQLSSNFWKYSYSYRGYDENHINDYHNKQLSKLNSEDIEAITLSKIFLEDGAYPYELITF